MQRGNAALSPDGQLALLSFVDGTEHLQAFAPDGSAAWGINAPLLDGSVEWLPDDLGVVALDATSNLVMWFRPGQPGQVLQDMLPSLPGRSVDRIIVVPH